MGDPGKRQNHVEGLLATHRQLELVGLLWGLEVGISNRSPSDSGACSASP